MGCNCNSNFSGGDQESNKLITELDRSLNEAYLPLMQRYSAYLNNGIKTGVYTDKSFKITLDDSLKKLLSIYKSKFDTKIKIEGNKREIGMITGAIGAQRNNPQFPLAEYEEKLKTKQDLVKKLESDYKELNMPIEPKISSKLSLIHI